MDIPEKSTTGIHRLRFYENWWLMAESRDTDEKRLAFYDAIMRYAFGGLTAAVPTANAPGTVWAAWDGFNVCRPILDGIIDEESLHDKRVAAGRLGGLAGTGTVKARPGNDNAARTDELIIEESKTQAKTQAPEIAKTQASEQANASTLLNMNMNMNMKMKMKDKEHLVGVSDVADYADAFFEGWWKSYPGPRKMDKKKCRAKFAAILKAADDPAQMASTLMAGLERWRKCELWTRDGGRFIRAPAVWLNNENWNDEAPAESVASSAEVANIHHAPTAEVQNAF